MVASTLFSKMESSIKPSGYTTTGLSFNEGVTHTHGGYYVIGNVCHLEIGVVIASASTSLNTYFSVPNSIKPKVVVPLLCINQSDDTGPYYSIANKNNSMVYAKGLPANNKTYMFSGQWLIG